jgi:hypothetical protein
VYFCELPILLASVCTLATAKPQAKPEAEVEYFEAPGAF